MRSPRNAAAPRFAFVFLLAAAVGCSAHGRPSGPTQGAAAGAPAKAADPRETVRDHVLSGNAFLKQELLDDAEREFRLALEIEPANQDALAGLGRVGLLRGQYSEAVTLLERATRVSVQMVGAFRTLGDAYAALGDLERATIAYRQAVALAPSDVTMRLSLVHSLIEIGAYREARDVCDGSLSLARSDPGLMARTYGYLGESYSREGILPEAMAAYYKAAELNPRDPELAGGLADAAVRGGLYAEAAAALTRMLQLKPLDIAAKKQLAWVNFKLERYPIAIKNYEAVGDSLGTVDRYYLAQAYAKATKVDRAVELFREVVRLDPENYRGVYCNMAYAYYEATRYQRAIEVVREGLNADSTSACLRYCWAQALDKLGRHEEAIPIFEAVAGDPAYAEPAKRELERQRRIVRLLKSKEKGN